MLGVRVLNEARGGDCAPVRYFASRSLIPSCTLGINHSCELCIKPCRHYKGCLSCKYHTHGSPSNLRQEDTGVRSESHREPTRGSCRLLTPKISFFLSQCHLGCLSVILKNFRFNNHNRCAKAPPKAVS